MSPEVLPKANTVRKRSALVIIIVLVIAESVASFESSTVFIALPRIMEFFSADLAQAQWVATSYMLLAAAFVVLAGRLGDMYGRKRILIIIMVLSIVGSFVSAFAPSLSWVIAGRALQGIAAATLPVCIGIARDHLPTSKVPVAVAAISASALFAGAGGAAVAGVLIQFADWHWIFLVAAYGGVVAIAIAAIFVPKDVTLDRSAKADWVGAVLLPSGITLALLAVTNGNSRGWTSAFVVGCAILGALLLVVWWVWQLKSPSPLFDVRLLKRRDLGFAYLINVCIALGALGMSVVTPGILQSAGADAVGFGLTPSVTGYLSAIGALAGGLSAFFSSKITTRFGAERTVQICTATLLISVGGMGLSLFWLPGFVITLSLQAAGVGLAFAGITNYLVASISAKHTGQVTGFASMVRTSFNAVSSGVIGTVLAAGIIPGTKLTATWAYTTVFATCALLLLVGFFLSLALPKRSIAVDDNVVNGNDETLSTATTAESAVSNR